MEKMNWTIDINQLKMEETWKPLSEDEIYTLKMPDFLKMPTMNFLDIARFDPDIRALLN